MKDNVNGHRTNVVVSNYDGFNLLADSMVDCVKNLPEAKRVAGLNKLTYNVGLIIKKTPFRNLSLRNGVNSYLQYLALIEGMKDDSGIAEIVVRLSNQRTSDDWLKIFRDDI